MSTCLQDPPKADQSEHRHTHTDTPACPILTIHIVAARTWLMAFWYLEVFEAAIEEQMFSACQGFPQQIVLRADSHHGVDVCHV